MRRFFLSSLAFAGLTSTVALTQPPGDLSTPRPIPKSATPAETKKLRADRSALNRDLEPPADAIDADSSVVSADRQRAALKAQLAGLIRQLGEDRKTERAPATTPTPPATLPPQVKIAPPRDGTDPRDVIRSAQNYFRTNAIEASLKTFQVINTNDKSLQREDRAFVTYMIACCHRRLGDYTNALTLYREVAAAKEDDFLAECALWQIGIIRSAQELDAELERLRSRKK